MASSEEGDCYFYTKGIRALSKLSLKDCLQCARLDLRFQATRFSKLQVDLFHSFPFELYNQTLSTKTSSFLLVVE